VSVLDAATVTQVRPGIEIVDPETLGVDELLESGMSSDDALLEIAARACARLGVREAVVPPGFPLATAEHLRAAGVTLHVDRALFDQRRRAKIGAVLEGVRRAARAAQAGMEAAASLLRTAEPAGGVLLYDGDALTCERVQAEVRSAFAAAGARGDELIVAHGAQAASGHDLGSGAIAPGETIIVDLWPQDPQTGAWADMARTFVAGEPPEDVVVWHNLCLDAMQRVLDALAPGVTGRELWEVACDVFEAAGERTQRRRRDDAAGPLRDGFFHSLGHGVGLEVHEQPALGRSGREPLVEGDVVAIEPGLYRHGYGGVRLEDLFRVTSDGCERLTEFPLRLAP